MSEKIVQTAGRDQLGEFAPSFAHFNDDILFGEEWNSQSIDLKTRCMITVVALVSSGITDSSLIYHLQNAKAHGVTKEEIADVLTHIAFYVGWPKGWAEAAEGQGCVPDHPGDHGADGENAGPDGYLLYAR